MKIAGEIESGLVERALDYLTDSKSLSNSDYVILIYGQGAQTRSFYNKLKKLDYVEVLWAGWYGPGWLSFLSFIPNQSGLIKVKSLEKLKKLFLATGVMSICTLIIVKESKAQLLAREIQVHNKKIKLDDFFKDTDDYFYYEVDDGYAYGSEEDEDIVYRVFAYGSGFDSSIIEGLEKEETEF